MKALRIAAGLVFLTACQRGLEGPAASLSGVSPNLVCSEQVSTAITVKGAGLSPLHENNLVDTHLELPKVTLVRQQDLAGAAASGTVEVPNAPDKLQDVTWTSQEEMGFTVCPPGTCSKSSLAMVDYEVAPGLYTLAVKNPNGKAAEFPSSLLVVPPPVLAKTVPDLLPVSEERTVTLTGDLFLRLAGDNGSLVVGDKTLPIDALDDCRDLPAVGSAKVEACQTATVKIPAGAFAQGTYELTVMGPGSDACHSVQSTDKVTLTFVRDPQVTAVRPDLACNAEGERTYELAGADFLVVDGVLPTVLVDTAEYVPQGATDCQDVTGPGLREAVQQCATLTFALPQGEPAVGLHAIGVRNPPTADVTSATTAPLTIVPPPTLTRLGTDTLCTAQEQRVLVLEGDGMIFIDGDAPLAPTVTISEDGTPLTTLVAEPVPETCQQLDRVAESARICSQVTVKLDQSTIGLGVFAVSVTNPEPAGCTSASSPTLLIVAPPKADMLAPAAICNAATGDSSLVVTGSHFIVVGEQGPTLRITDASGANPVLVPTVPSNCEQIAGEGLSAPTTMPVFDCTTLAAAIPATVLTGASTYQAEVQGVEGVGCHADPLMLSAASGPTLSSVSAAQICVGGGTLRVTGAGLRPEVKFSLVASGGAPAFLADNVVLSSCTAADGSCDAATLHFGVTPAGSYTVHASLAGQCESMVTTEIPVTSGPLVFSVDPPVAYAGVSTSATVYVANMSGAEITRVTFFPDGEDPETSASAVRFTGSDLDTSRAGRAVVRLPAGLAEGSWSVLVELTGACGRSMLAGAVDVVKDLTPNLTLTLSPSYGHVSEDVPVTITSTLPLDSIPLVYLSNATSPSATALIGASLQSPTSIAAVVPANRLTAGQHYDLVLVGTSNGGRVVGLAANVWTANALPTPVINAVTPESLPTGTDAVKVSGANFNATTTMKLACIDSNGLAVASPTFTAGPTVVSASEIDFSATFSSTQALCDVIVTNADQSTFRFSSIVVSNPAQKLGAFSASASLNVARRALGATTARANATSRFLYAIGGDSGTEESATTSVEVASIDASGRLGNFISLPRADRGAAGLLVGPSLALKTPHTYTQAVTIGRWLWAVGGSDGTGAIADVERAFVLDPLNVATISDVDISLDATNGLGGGTWLYRIAPVMGPDDPYNPNGELLASEPMTVRLPAVITGGVDVTIKWERFLSAGKPAAKYNVYRTPNQQKLGEDDVIWIGQVSGDNLQYTDRGGLPAKPFAHPLPVGSTGVWQTTAPDLAGTGTVNLALLQARSGAGVAVMRDPVVQVPGRDVYYLYAVSGNSGTETNVTINDGTEYMVVEVDTATQIAYASGFKAGTTVQLTKPGGAVSPHGKWQASAFAGSPDSIPYDPNKGYLYLASGLRSSAVAEVIDSTHVMSSITFGSGATPAGQPSTWTEANPSGFGGQAGYAGIFVNGFAYGLGGIASVGLLDSCVQSQNQTTTTLVTGNMSNPSSCSVSLHQARMLAASATASGYLFVIGGSTSQAPSATGAVSTIERSIY